MPEARVNGVSINYRQAGQGPDLILIHGLAANNAFWNMMVVLPLSRRYRVTMYDLRGHGYSEMPPTGYRSTDLAGDLFGLMDHLRIDRAHLVGHSFGGQVALHATMLQPARVASLTLADTRIRALQPTQRIRDWPDWQEAKAEFHEYGIPIDENEDEVGMRLLEIIASPTWAQNRERLAKQGIFVPFGGWSNGNRSAERWLDLLNTTTARRELSELDGLTVERLGEVHQPILAIYGEHSRCLTSCEGLTAVLPQTHVVIVPEAGHFYPVVRPAFVAETVMKFLEEGPSPQWSEGTLTLKDVQRKERAADAPALQPTWF